MTSLNLYTTKSSSTSIKDLITFYEKGTSTSHRFYHSTTPSNDLLNSSSDTASNKSFSSKSSSSLSLNEQTSPTSPTPKLNINLVSSALHSQTAAVTALNKRIDLISQKQTHSSLAKRKSTSFCIAKPNYLTVKTTTQQQTTNGLSTNVRKFDPKSIQKIVLEWCQNRTKNYQNVNITNFSSSWADGLAFCALIHSYIPDAFDYSKLTSQNRRYNFQLAFDVAYKRANIVPLLEVNDMISMGNRPDDRCIYTYLSTIYSRLNKPKARCQKLEEIKEFSK